MSMNAMEDATKSAVSHAKQALLSTMKDIPKFPGKLDIPKFSGKPPKIRGLLIFPLREKGKDHVVVPILPSSVSAQDLRSLEDVEKETVGSIEEVSPRGSTTEDNTRSTSDSETFSSKESTSSADINSNSGNNSASLWRSFFRLWRQKSMRRLSSFPPRIGVARLSKWKSGKLNHGEGPIESSDNDFCFFKPSWKSFTTSELKNATNNFSEENLIGKGGFAEVYEGCLEDGQFVAVKRLVKGALEERTNNFLAELGILVHINHPNIAKLIGVGVEEDLHLVLRLSPHGSLSSLLHGSKGKLEWDVRYKIAIGTAEGLEYLHDRCQRRIIHRDIKAANILLTEDFEPQICDFGLAKWLPDQLTHHTLSSFEGTFGYLAPEYLTHGVVDEKTDVFAFGVLLLELISGRKALDSSQQSLVMWAKPLIDRDEIKELVDPALGESYDHKQLKQLVAAACLCIQHSSMLRPRISEVLAILKGEEGRKSDTSPNVHMHQAPLRRRTYSEELLDAEEYNATRYLKDLNRHKQIALDFRGVNEVPDKGSGECNSE